jgi:hypothetical protein
MYRHTQTGWTIWGICLILALLAALGAVAGSEGARVAVAVLLAVVVLFPSLTVTVDPEGIEVQYGTGVIRRRFPLAEVDTCAPVRNPWWWGWGIKVMWGSGGRPGWLYNISGLEAVELRMKDGRLIRIGTDEPERLSEAIREQLRHRDEAGLELID